MQCLIGETPPSAAGIGFPSSRVLVATALSFWSGLHVYARAVYFARSAGDGNLIHDIAPVCKLPMYSRTERGGPSGTGPCRFVFGESPFPFATRMFPASSKRTDVGCHPVGMNPSDLAFPGSDTLNTARLLLSALATSRNVPSFDKARLVGVLPLGAFG